MKIYRVEIINDSWSGSKWFLERHYSSDLSPKKIKEKFDNIKGKYLNYYTEKVEKHHLDDDLVTWSIYRERLELLNSFCSIQEIEVINDDEVLFCGIPITKLNKEMKRRYEEHINDFIL